MPLIYETFIHKRTSDECMNRIRNYIVKNGGHYVRCLVHEGDELYTTYYLLDNNFLERHCFLKNILEKSSYKTISYVNISNPNHIMNSPQFKSKLYSNRLIYKNSENDMYIFKIVSNLPKNVHKFTIKKILIDNNISYDESTLFVKDFATQLENIEDETTSIKQKKQRNE